MFKRLNGLLILECAIKFDLFRSNPTVFNNFNLKKNAFVELMLWSKVFNSKRSLNRYIQRRLFSRHTVIKNKRKLVVTNAIRHIPHEYDEYVVPISFAFFTV